MTRLTSAAILALALGFSTSAFAQSSTSTSTRSATAASQTSDRPGRAETPTFRRSIRKITIPRLWGRAAAVQPTRPQCSRSATAPAAAPSSYKAARSLNYSVIGQNGSHSAGVIQEGNLNTNTSYVCQGGGTGNSAGVYQAGDGNYNWSGVGQNGNDNAAGVYQTGDGKHDTSHPSRRRATIIPPACSRAAPSTATPRT